MVVDSAIGGATAFFLAGFFAAGAAAGLGAADLARGRFGVALGVVRAWSSVGGSATNGMAFFQYGPVLALLCLTCWR